MRPCPELDNGNLSSTIRPTRSASIQRVDSSEPCLSIKIEQFEQMQSAVVCCDDPEHVEAQQIILEMHQVNYCVHRLKETGEIDRKRAYIR